MQRGRNRSAFPPKSPAIPSFVDPELDRLARIPGGFVGVGYERFLQMSVAVVLTVLWLAGTASLSSCVLILYALGTLMASVVAGA